MNNIEEKVHKEINEQDNNYVPLSSIVLFLVSAAIIIGGYFGVKYFFNQSSENAGTNGFGGLGYAFMGYVIILLTIFALLIVLLIFSSIKKKKTKLKK